MEQSHITIYRFFRDFVPDYDEVEHTNPITGNVEKQRKLNGRMRERHWVEYGPLGSDKMRTEALVDSLRKVASMDDAHRNPGIIHARARWLAIEPRYEAWKKGQELPVEGTPLAAFNGLDQAQADRLRSYQIYTVEQLVTLNDTHFTNIGIPGLRNIVENAKRFLTANQGAAVQQALADRDVEIRSLRDMVEQLTMTISELARAQQAGPTDAVINIGGVEIPETPPAPGADTGYEIPEPVQGVGEPRVEAPRPDAPALIDPTASDDPLEGVNEAEVVRAPKRSARR